MMAWRRLIVVAGLGAPAIAMACGACVEDTVAATYDHAVASRATAQKQVLVFTAVDGIGDARVLASKASAAARRVAGVDRSSVRVSSEPLALSFALDPKAQTVAGAVARVQERGHDQGIKLSVVRVVP